MKTQNISHFSNFFIIIFVVLFFFKTNITKTLAQEPTSFSDFGHPSIPDIKLETNLNDTIYSKEYPLKIEFLSERSTEVDKVGGTTITIKGIEVPLGHIEKSIHKSRKTADIHDEFIWHINLIEGENKVRVAANDLIGHLDTTISITYINPSRPALHLLLIGNNYENQKNISKLPYVRNSLNTIKNAFQKKSNYPPISIKELFKKNATKAKIKQAIKKLSEKVKENDIVVIYFANHANKEAIVLAESTHIDDTDPEKTISKGDLKSFMGKLPCKTLLLLDVCHSSQLIPDTEPTDNQAITVEGYKKNDPRGYSMKYPKAKMVIAATTNIAYEIHKLENSIFADAFESMFQNKAGDHNKDGYIDFGEMKRYLKKEMEKLSTEYDIKQKPNFSPYESSDIDHIPISKIKK